MKPWSNPQTVAVLWMIAAVIVVGWLAGLVSEYQARLQWSHVEPVPTVTHPRCPRVCAP